MKIKEEHLDKNISCPFTGKHMWVRELEPSVYSHYASKGYEWLFEEKVEEISEEEFFTEIDIKKKK
jgi:hypothetical protein